MQIDERSTALVEEVDCIIGEIPYSEKGDSLVVDNTTTELLYSEVAKHPKSVESTMKSDMTANQQSLLQPLHSVKVNPCQTASPTNIRVSNPVRDRLCRQQQHVQSQHQVESLKESIAVDEGDTEAFIGVKRTRVNTRAFFLGGINKKVNAKQIYEYLLQRDITPTLLKVFSSKRKGTMSAKLNVKSKDIARVLAPDFWPKYVRCWAWLTQKRFQEDVLLGGRQAHVSAAGRNMQPNND